MAAPEAEEELAVGFFGSRYERATPAEREYMRAMAEIGAANGDEPVPTAEVAEWLGRKPSSLSPARDSLIKKGLVYSAERGLIGFTVPHSGGSSAPSLSDPVQAGRSQVRRHRPLYGFLEGKLESRREPDSRDRIGEYISLSSLRPIQG